MLLSDVEKIPDFAALSEIKYPQGQKKRSLPKKMKKGKNLGVSSLITIRLAFMAATI